VSQKYGPESPRIVVYLPLCERTRRRDFSFLDCAQGTQSRANQFGSRKELRTCHFQSDNRLVFVFRRNTKRDYFLRFGGSSISLEERVCCRIRCRLGTRRLLAANRKGNEGSNPTLSASKSYLPRNSAALSPKMREQCSFFAIIPQQNTLRRTDCSAANGVTVPAFLRRAHAQSGFKEGIRRMQCDQKLGIGDSELTFVGILESDFGVLPISPFLVPPDRYERS